MGPGYRLNRVCGKGLRRLICSVAAIILLGAGVAQAQSNIGISDPGNTNNQTGAPGQPLANPLLVQFFGTFGSTDVLWQIQTDDTGGAALNHVGDIETVFPTDVVLNFATGAPADGPVLSFGPNAGNVQVAVCEAILSATWTCSGTPFFFNASALAPAFTLTKISPDPRTAQLGQTFDVTVQVHDGLGLPVSGMNVRFLSNPGTVTPEDTTIPSDVNGEATATLTAAQVGNFMFALSVSIDPDGVPSTGDEAVVDYDYDFTAAPANLIPDVAADNQTGMPGSSLPLALHVSNIGGTAATVLWTVTSDNTGGATLNLAGDLDPLPGTGAVTINPSQQAGPVLTFGGSAGTVQVDACDSFFDTGTNTWVCLSTPFYTFNAEALAGSVLIKLTPDPVLATTGSAFSVSVRLEDGVGNPMSGQNIQFAATPGIMTPDNNSATTDSGGTATASFVAGAPGTFANAMTVSADPDGVPSSGDEVSVTFSFDFATGTGNTLIKPAAASGDGQTGAVGSQLALPLRVLAQSATNSPLPGTAVDWSVLSGDAITSASNTITDSSGIAQVNVFLGATAGTSIIRASSPSIPGSVQDYLVTAVDDYRFEITQGNGQLGQINSDSDQLVVRVVLNNVGEPGVPVQWAVVSGDGTLQTSSSTTNSNGFAATILHFGALPGDVVVRASAPSRPVAPLDFTLRSDAGPPPPGTVILAVHAGDGQSGPITTRVDNPLVAELTDDSGEPLPGRTIIWQLMSGDAALDAVQSSTDTDGFAAMQFSYGASPGPLTIRATLAENNDVLADFQATGYLPLLILQSGDGQSGGVSSELIEDFVIAIAPPAAPLAKSLEGVVVDWQVVEGGGTLSTTSSSTDSNGRASTRLTLGPNPGPNRVSASIDGVPAIVFNATGLAAQVIERLRVVSGDGQQLPTNTPSAPLVVEALDSDGQPVEDVALQWSIDNGNLLQSTSVTGEDGRSSNVAQVALPGGAQVTVTATGAPDLQISFSLNGGIANIPGLTDNQREVAETIDQLCPALLAMDQHDPEQMDLLARCLELVENAGDHADEVIGALDALMPDVSLVQAHAALLTASTQFNNVRSRLTLLHSGNRKLISVDGLSLSGSNGSLPLALLPEAGDDTETGTDFSRWGFFANGSIGRGNVDRYDSRPQYDFSSAGLTAGVDYRVNDHWFAGVALGYARQDNDLGNDDGHVNTKGWSVTGYSTWFNPSNWYVDGVLTYGRNDYDLLRRIDYSIHSGSEVIRIDQLASASSGGDQLNASFSFGRDFQKGAWNFGPYARASWTRLGFDSYEERLRDDLPGAGLGLAVASRDLDASSLVLGGKASMAISRDWGVLMPNFSLEWEHQLQDDPQYVAAHFLADPSRSQFEIRGDVLDRDFYRMGIGLSALWAGGRSGYIYYEYLAGASGISQGNIAIGLRLEF